MSSFGGMEQLPNATAHVPPLRDPQALLARARSEWGGQSDLWIFGYASLLWRPEFEFTEHRAARDRCG